jgi:hypothetical protein
MCQTFIFLSIHLSLWTCHPYSWGIGVKLFLFIVPIYICGHVTLVDVA